MIRLKRKRVAALKRQLSPERAPADEPTEAKVEKCNKEKEGGGPSASTRNQKQREEEMDFLLVLRQ